MKERQIKQIMARKSGVTLLEDRLSNQLIGKYEITLFWRQLLWEFTDGTDLNKNKLILMECFDIIKIDLGDFDITVEDQRSIRRIIGQLAKRSHVILLLHEEFLETINHGAEIPLLNMLSADKVQKEQ